MGDISKEGTETDWSSDADENSLDQGKKVDVLRDGCQKISKTHQNSGKSNWNGKSKPVDHFPDQDVSYPKTYHGHAVGEGRHRAIHLELPLNCRQDDYYRPDPIRSNYCNQGSYG